MEKLGQCADLPNVCRFGKPCCGLYPIWPKTVIQNFLALEKSVIVTGSRSNIKEPPFEQKVGSMWTATAVLNEPLARRIWNAGCAKPVWQKVVGRKIVARVHARSY